MFNTNKERQSGIELLKVITCFLIVLYHCNQTSIEQNFYNLIINNTEYYFSICVNLLGNLLNNIFIVCSSWYMFKKNIRSTEKILYIGINTFVISILILFVYLINGINIDKEYIIKCLLPISKENNWFVTAYILLCLFSGYINKLLYNLEKKEHFWLCLIVFLLYYILNFLGIGSYYYNTFIGIISTYLLVSYIQLYKAKICGCIKINFTIFIISTLCFFMCGYSVGKYLYFDVTSICNPFSFLIVISLFNLFSKIKLKNSAINTISSLSLLIYLFHENILFRKITRPQLMEDVFLLFNENSIVFKLIVSSFCLFVVSIMLSYIYKLLFDRLIKKVTTKISNLLEGFFNKLFKSIGE